MLMEPTDLELIQLSLRNTEKFALLIDRYEQKLFRYTMRLGNFSIAEWEDILQDIFIRVYTHLNEYDESFTFSSWIYRIAHNTTIDAYRKNSRKEIIRIDDEMYEWLKETISSDEDLPKNLREKDMRFLVQNAFQSLNPEQREVIILKYIEWRDYSEISDILRIPIGTVGTLIHRAKKQLQWSLTSIHNHL